MDKMDVARLVLEYLRTLVWPAVVAGLAFGFRADLRRLLGRIRRAELPGGVKVDFPEELGEAQVLSAKVEATPPPPDRRKGPSIPLTEANARMLSLELRPSPSGLDMDYYRVLASQDPNLALAGLRIELDVLARNLAKKFGVQNVDKLAGSRLLDRLHSAGAITDQQLLLSKKVLRLCNAAIHGTRVSREDAESVIDIADVLVSQFLDWLSWGFEDGWKPRRDRGEAG